MDDNCAALSRQREVEAWLAMGAIVGDKLQWIMKRDYDPSDVSAPAGYERVLAAYS